MENNSGLQPLREHRFTDNIVRIFLNSNLSLILILLAVIIGLTALFMTPREEDPQIVVPLADVYVNFPGHSAAEVEQMVTTPLEKILYQIDGVEYVYSMSRQDQAIITVRFFVGEDRERSLVKLYKKIQENLDIVPPGLAGWVIKPVEIDDVPIVTMTLTSAAADDMELRRTAEEVIRQLTDVKDVSRAYVVGGRPRKVQIYMDPDRMAAYQVSPLELQSAVESFNLSLTAGDFRSRDNLIQIAAGSPVEDASQLQNIVVAVSDGHPVFLKDVAKIVDGPEEISNYVRHGWGPAGNVTQHRHFPGTALGGYPVAVTASEFKNAASPAVTIAIAKKRGANAVWIADAVLQKADTIKQTIISQDMELIVTRNSGLTADEKVNELVWALVAAIIIITVLLSIGLGWREAMIVAMAVPVVFGLTLAVNMLLGFTINRVTLFALILALGLLVDDPIVDVENISRHFDRMKKASRNIVLAAVAEIRPPLIIATLAVIISFLPMFFITGMMGPYMRPMALNVPVTMIMSMLVSFTITPWFAYHVLKCKYTKKALASNISRAPQENMEDIRQTRLYKFFYPLMEPLMHSRRNAWIFLMIIAMLTFGAMWLGVVRGIPLKMLPFDNKNELLLLLDMDEGTTLERTDAAVRDFENYLAGIPEVVDYISYVGVPSPIDFNGLVRHYYIRQGDNRAEIRINLADKNNRKLQSHGIGLRMRDALQKIANRHNVKMKLVETPPGPPVIASVTAEVYGPPDSTYQNILSAADTVKARLAAEPGVADLDDVREAPRTKFTFVPDNEKAAMHGISTATIAGTIKAALAGTASGIIHSATELNPLIIELRLPVAQRTGLSDLAGIYVKGKTRQTVQLSEIGHWRKSRVDQQIYHKNLRRVAYVFAETVGRPPADVVVDVQSDKTSFKNSVKHSKKDAGIGWVDNTPAKPVSKRTFLAAGGGIKWAVPDNYAVTFSGEGEWKITLDVFRDLGLAFAAALIGIYILLVAQTGSFALPAVIMLAIPLTVLGVMPGFWLLNVVSAQSIGGFLNPVYFTATGMIGMIALSGIVTRDSIILVDFIHLSLARGRTLFDAIMESRVVRLRPILLTAGAAMFGAVPIILDPIFSGLAWALIFGLFASTIFTLFVIPVAYWLIYANKPGHGLPESAMEHDKEKTAIDVKF